ncbi:FitA-like ribbon-helix-helix domain-containing protein [Elioraea sp.]|uniref:FitA-like ribbon-helix-helix domain-containing protein n=1 Tax=Elioraea sp. TaxID=2185103 RepID=UPI00307F0ED3
MQSSLRPAPDTTTLTIRRLDPAVKERLRLRAARHGRSMEEEARRILGAALDAQAAPPANAFEALHRRFALIGGVDLDPPPRDRGRPPPDFSGPEYG